MIYDESGAVYFINAEHPPMVLYRDGRATFVDQARPLHKLGIVLGGGQLHIQTLRLLPGDALFAGSDGRDDLETGRDENGGRVINEDETLFLRHVEAGRGELRAVAAEIEKSGELTDDLSLMRIEYIPSGGLANANDSAADLKRARELIEAGKMEDAQHLLETLHARDPRAGAALKSLAKLHYKAGRHAEAAALAREYLENHPYDTDFLHFASMTLIKVGDLTEAADIAERVRMRRPDYVENLERLAKIYERLGNADRAGTMRREADAIRAGTPPAKGSAQI
jgi:tetratricopeptide (TPR) repeat protein